MKIRGWIRALALALVLCMLPLEALAEAVPPAGADKPVLLVEYRNEQLGTRILESLDLKVNGSLSFMLREGTAQSHQELATTAELTLEDPAVAEVQTSGKVFWLTGRTPGQTNLKITFGDGRQMLTIPVQVSLPQWGVYSKPAAVFENLMPEGLGWTPENNSFYIMPQDSSYQIANVTVTMGKQQMAAEMISTEWKQGDACFKVTIPDYDKLQIVGERATLQFEMTYSSGTCNETNRLKVNLWDNRQKVGYVSDWEQPDREWLETSFDVTVNGSRPFVLREGTERNHQPLADVEGVRVLDEQVAQVREKQDKGIVFYELRGLQDGQTQLKITFAGGREAVLLPIRVQMPEVAAYSGTQVLPEQLLRGRFDWESGRRSFYLVLRDPNWTMKSVTVTDGGGNPLAARLVQVELLGSHAKVTIDDPGKLPGRDGIADLRFEVGYQKPDGRYESKRVVFLEIRDRAVADSPVGMTTMILGPNGERDIRGFKKTINSECIGGHHFLLRTGDPEHPEPLRGVRRVWVEDPRVAFAYADWADTAGLSQWLQEQKLPDQHEMVYQLIFYGLGSTYLHIEMWDGQVYRMPLSTHMPNTGLYTDPEAVFDNLLFHNQFYWTEEKPHFYVGVKEGLTLTGVTLDDIMTPEARAAVELGAVEQGRFVKVTVKDPEILKRNWFQLGSTYLDAKGNSHNSPSFGIFLENNWSIVDDIFRQLANTKGDSLSFSARVRHPGEDRDKMVDVYFDPAALAQIQGQHQEVTMETKAVEKNQLTPEQQAALGKQDVAFDLALTAGEEKVEFAKGHAVVSLPFEGMNGRDYRCFEVYYVAEDGTRTKMEATYEDGSFVFTTNHFSTYVISEMGSEARFSAEKTQEGVHVTFEVSAGPMHCVAAVYDSQGKMLGTGMVTGSAEGDYLKGDLVIPVQGEAAEARLFVLDQNTMAPLLAAESRVPEIISK